jgi:TRAP-type uncharacterized transport system substrate-binding protein
MMRASTEISMRLTPTILALLALSLAPAAHAQSLAERLAKQHPQTAEITVRVAAGVKTKGNYAQVVPILAQQLAGTNVALVPDESTGSFMSATGVCLGLDEAGIVQRDAASVRAHVSDGNAASCTGKYVSLGRPLYPYYGFWVVRADTPYKRVSGQIEHVKAGQVLNVAAGEDGSGGQITLKNLLDADPRWRSAVHATTDGGTAALRLLRDKNIDAFFLMDSRNSEMIEQSIKAEVDSRGRPVFKFLAINAPAKFFALTDWTGKTMYQPETLTAGWFGGVKTISVDAVFIVNRAWWHKDASTRGAVEEIGRAIDTAASAIRAATQTPADWVPASEQKK